MGKRKLATQVFWAVAAAAVVQGVARADDDFQLPGGYHAQVTNFFCAAASLEMQLDTPAVRNTNAVVTQMLNAGDGPTVPENSPLPIAGITIVNGVGTVSPGGAQSFIYGLNHGLNTVNGLGYFNPFSPPGTGTDSLGIVVAANLLDNPNANGITNPGWAFGNHSYSGFNMTSVRTASRTIANALSDYQVPAVAAINHGSHAISVYGVATTGDISTRNYTINGFYVHDPWTGWAVSQLRGGQFNINQISANGGIGLGYNTYVRYGYDAATDGPSTEVAPGVFQNVRLAPWVSFFNVAGGQFGAGPQYATPGYKFEVEPLGPELPDAVDTGPLILPELPGEITEPTAMTDLTSDLSTDPQLSGDFSGGTWDTADAELIQVPGETGQGDWLVPYDGPAPGTGDMLGGALIDANTGVIDMATWIDPNDPNQLPLTLSELDTLFEEEVNGFFPQDDIIVPEPATLGLLLPAGMLLMRRKRRS